MTISTPEDLLRHGVVEHMEPRRQEHANGTGPRHDQHHHQNNGRSGERERPKEKKFHALRLDAIQAPAGVSPLVEDVLLPRTLAVVFGESGSGKSFFVAHMSLHAALAWPWAGKDTVGGAVVYITAEGATGFRKRMVAFREKHNPPTDAPFYVIADAPDLGHKQGDAAEIVARIKEQVGPRLILLVIDTMARVMHGADENSAADVSVLIANANDISAALDCTVLLVHHAGKDASRGARGSSALRAAADTEIFVERSEGGHRASVTKQKDLEGGLSLAFTIEPFDLHNGDTSCSVHVETWQRSGGATAKKVTGAALVAFRALKEAIGDHGSPPPPDSLLGGTIRVVPLEVWKGYCERVSIADGTGRDAKRKAFYRAARKLQDAGMIGVFNDVVWLMDRVGHVGQRGTN